MKPPQGLSHIVCHAGNREDYEKTREFYLAIGFKHILKERHESDAVTWLVLTAAPDAFSTDITVQLILSTGVIPQDLTTDQPKDTDEWKMEGVALVLTIKQLDSMKTQLQAIGARYKDKSSIDGKTLELHVLDPLNNGIIFANRPAFPNLLDASTLSSQHFPQSSRKDGTPKRIGVLTSGGDAPGMNPAVRAVVRYSISKGCEVFGIYEGYQGLVDGGKFIRKMDWKSVRGWLAVGGTSIGTARCMSFKTREGRLKAASNLIKNGIDSLVVCGGDGSLTGADVFRSEWSGLVDELLATDRITKEEASEYNHLTIVGLVGSIDNDMSSTDITIGAVTSLHRICESVDSIGTTASSHSRAFVVEVMGRHCGWLALMAGIATGADFVFIPERPPPDDWETTICNVAHRHRELGKRKTVIIVAEGAIDTSLNPIKADKIKDILTERLGLDTRVTTLGHTQRGGSPAAFDRILATIQGVAAVDAVLRSTPDMPSPLIGMSNNEVTCKPLMKAVKLTHEVAEAIGEKNFARAMELRDPQFAEEYNVYNASTILDDHSLQLPDHLQLRIGILHVGAPAGGMNAATRTAVRYAVNRGHTPIAIYNGFDGLIKGAMSDLTWSDVDGWTSRGGSELGTNRHVPGEQLDMGMVAYQMQEFNLQGLLIIGGFEAFSCLKNLENARARYPSLCIPMCVIPATVSNNVPGTDYSLGTDTALNAIVNSCDAIIQSARSSRRRVFVVEVQGGRSGYLAVEAGLASGANTIYIPEEGIDLTRLQSDVHHLMALYMDDDPNKSEGRIVLRNETVSKTYTTDVISSIFKEEGHALFDSRTAVLGHIQQGNTPSPMDRIRATRLGMSAIQFMERETEQVLNLARGQSTPVELCKTDKSAVVVGLDGAGVSFMTVKQLEPLTDIKNRKPKKAWWYQRRPLVDLLAGRGLFSPGAQSLRSS
ncbi:6-phosphofructokinase [Halteromyces radiatus]|uniref:6-phosphofructokinase n=1 Tax=Halteromyces radiatus TaxID=101107 RepID=UPI002220CDE1|nr:6-phosphofructokinase [Halteromyces radiatus]KAI8092642.1 6-phosphofructokinase [Halteromyces radiatus]